MNAAVQNAAPLHRQQGDRDHHINDGAGRLVRTPGDQRCRGLTPHGISPLADVKNLECIKEGRRIKPTPFLNN